MSSTKFNQVDRRYHQESTLMLTPNKKTLIEDTGQPQCHRLSSIESTQNIIKNVDNQHDTSNWRYGIQTSYSTHRYWQNRRSQRISPKIYKHLKKQIEVDYQQKVSDQCYIRQQQRRRPSSLKSSRDINQKGKYVVNAYWRPNQQEIPSDVKIQQENSINNIGQQWRHQLRSNESTR